MEHKNAVPNYPRVIPEIARPGSGKPLATGAHSHEAVRVCQKLRLTLARFAGAEGFTSLLRRAMVLARAEVPALNSITVKPDHSIEGLEGLAANAEDGGAEAAGALISNLLGLLVTFIGDPLTLRLVRESWPEIALDEIVSKN